MDKNVPYTIKNCYEEITRCVEYDCPCVFVRNSDTHEKKNIESARIYPCHKKCVHAKLKMFFETEILVFDLYSDDIPCVGLHLEHLLLSSLRLFMVEHNSFLCFSFCRLVFYSHFFLLLVEVFARGRCLMIDTRKYIDAQITALKTYL